MEVWPHTVQLRSSEKINLNKLQTWIMRKYPRNVYSWEWFKVEDFALISFNSNYAKEAQKVNLFK